MAEYSVISTMCVLIWFHEKSNYLTYFLLNLILRKNAIVLVISFLWWFHEKRRILHYFFLKLISRKNVNIALFLSEIDVTNENCVKSIYEQIEQIKCKNMIAKFVFNHPQPSGHHNKRKKRDGKLRWRTLFLGPLG